MRTIIRNIVTPLVLACTLASPSWAARDFTPQAGLWMIPSERNGQPGRGFSLDVQGNTLFMQVFNYDNKGAATFHTASGQMDGNRFSGPLQRYKNGRYFGGPAQTAEPDGSPGEVRIEFTDGLNGTVQFPGEAVQPVSRFLVNEPYPFLWERSSNNPPTGFESTREMRLITDTPDGERYFWAAYLEVGFESYDHLSLRLHPMGSDKTHNSSYYFKCSFQEATQVMPCEITPPSPDAPSGSDKLQISRMNLRFVGHDVVGVIQPSTSPEQRLTVNGWVLASTSCKEPCNSPATRSAWTHTQHVLAQTGCITGACFGYGHVAVLPSSGAWSVEEERNGRPGRGVFLDVQESTIIVQTSDYLASGNSTFHMGSGSLVPSENRWEDPGITRWDDTTATLPAVRYTGGRYFGGPASSAREEAQAGSFALRFTPSYAPPRGYDFASGVITLPNEGPKRISRLQLEPPANALEAMLGEHLFMPSTGSSRVHRWVRLTRIQDNVLMSDDGQVQCRDISQDGISRVRCKWPPTKDWVDNADVDVHYSTRYDEQRNYLLRTRDRHGNWLGLGKVNLPGLDIAQD